MRRFGSRRLLTAAVLPAIAAVGLLVPTTATAAPAACAFTPTTVSASSGFTAGEKSAPFATAKPANHIATLDAFSSLSPLIKQQNLLEAIAVNNAASPKVSAYAVDDNYAIEGPAIFNALGSKLSPAFFDALKAGQLPKTSELLLGDKALVGDRVGTSKEKKYFDYRRPFEVAPTLIRHYGDGRPDLYESVRGSGSYPSGHTTWGYTQAFLIATMLPEVGPQVLARGAEYGYHRVVLGVHYPLDVIGGRMLAENITSEVIADPSFATLLAQARTELRSVLAARVGAPIGRIVGCQQPYIGTDAALSSYRRRSTFSFLPTGPAAPLQVPAGAENLIRAAHPGWSTQQLRDLLARTALPGGYPLDKTGANGGWQRLDIARAWVAR
ncbi:MULTISPECIES: acid phosphatase [Gordonia]|uniref:acid phosphatase n=1 Tax=Gordonia TaxID=2053 RepID=UPI0007EA59E1|nr:MULTISPECIES: phosphatase PAP2 family protein [Gordonia]OBA32688.1 PA-phosphatase [Gordonia sp. 852002-51296_SCH5728562-b]OBC05618.1 PA-phosphatase [Gordonia sp. 852002-50395_SCH5434458]